MADQATATRRIPLHHPLLRVTNLLFLIYAGIGALAVVDGTLTRMHQPGGASASATAILSPSSMSASDARLEAILQWRLFVETYDFNRGDRVMSPFGLLVIYLFVDIIFIAVPIALLLWKAILFARDRLDPADAADPKNELLIWVIGIAALPTAAFLLFDFLEDFSLVLFVRSGSDWAQGLIGVGLLSTLKLIALAGAAAGVGVGLLGNRPRRDDMKTAMVGTRDKFWSAFLALRIHVAIAAFLLVLVGIQGDLGRQLDDAFLLLFEKPGRLVLTVVIALILTAALWGTGRLSVRAYMEPPGLPRTPVNRIVNTVILGLGIAAAILGFVAINSGWPWGQALLVPGIIVAVIAAFSYKHVQTAAQAPAIVIERNSEQAEAGARLAGALSVAPMAILFALALRNLIRFLTIREWGSAAWVLAVLVPSVVVALVVAYWRRDLGSENPPWWWVPALGTPAVALFVGLAWSPQWTGISLAPWGTVFAFVLALALGLTALLLVGDSTYPGNLLAACRLRRLPIIAIMTICFLATSFIDNQSVYHATRLLGPADAGETKERMPLAQALEKWADEQPQNQPEIPLVFVASSGGGIRAAYWTSLVLGCLIESGDPYTGPPNLAPDAETCKNQAMPMESMFLASGISGGSLGLAVTQAIANRNDWWTPLQGDFLGPAIAAMTFRDIPNALLRINIHDQDRAAALERAWEKAVAEAGGDLGAGFMATALPDRESPTFPLLALNGASVTDGCRLTVSPLNLAGPQRKNGPDTADTSAVDCLALDPVLKNTDVVLQTLAGTKDAFDLTCREGEGTDPQDLRLSTAALLSARFPYVSPTGTLNSCKNLEDRTFDLDGGIIDSSGASPLALAWPEIVGWLTTQNGRCISPKLILIENGYLTQTKSRPAAPPGELTAPLAADRAASDARSASARQAAALAFQKSFPPGGCGNDRPGTPAPGGWQAPNVVDFYPVASPGVEAPLGWTLAKYSQESLEQQLGNPNNQCAAAIVAAWFTGDTQEPQACKELRKAPQK
ncbi:MAG: hypothetical protein ACRDU5_17530 [Mycobacterium sp.]